MKIGGDGRQIRQERIKQIKASPFSSGRSGRHPSINMRDTNRCVDTEFSEDIQKVL